MAHKPKTYKVCPIQNKNMLTHAQAVHEALIRSTRQGQGLRVYKCPHCHSYHITKQAKRK